jgi:hypothetical protein
MEYFAFWFVTVFHCHCSVSIAVATAGYAASSRERDAETLSRPGKNRAFRTGVPITSRSDWKSLSHRFLAELVSRLRSKEDIMRFIGAKIGVWHNNLINL